MKLQVGLRVKFREERGAYTVRSSGKRYTVCTKPFNPLKTVLYTIIDWREGIRGAENLVFCFGAESTKDCKAMLARLEEEGGSKVSYRNRVRLCIDSISKGLL